VLDEPHGGRGADRPSASTATIACITAPRDRFAMWRSIMMADIRSAIGFATFLPSDVGAPRRRTASKTAAVLPMLPLPTTPRPHESGAQVREDVA